MHSTVTRADLLKTGPMLTSYMYVSYLWQRRGNSTQKQTRRHDICTWELRWLWPVSHSCDLFFKLYCVAVKFYNHCVWRYATCIRKSNYSFPADVQKCGCSISSSSSRSNWARTFLEGDWHHRQLVARYIYGWMTRSWKCLCLSVFRE